MKTRYEAAKELGFQESDTKDGLLWWFCSDRDDEMKVFLDFRTKDDQGEYDGFSEDMPPEIYAATNPHADDDDEEDETVWVDKNGDTREQWKEEVKNHWTVQQVEEMSGMDASNRGQSSLDWYSDDGMEETECDKCGESFAVADIEEGLCIGDETNGCYYDEYPEELFRQAKRRKERIRNND